MKKHLRKISFVVIAILALSCKKDDDNNLQSAITLQDTNVQNQTADTGRMVKK